MFNDLFKRLDNLAQEETVDFFGKESKKSNYAINPDQKDKEENSSLFSELLKSEKTEYSKMGPGNGAENTTQKDDEDKSDKFGKDYDSSKSHDPAKGAPSHNKQKTDEDKGSIGLDVWRGAQGVLKEATDDSKDNEDTKLDTKEESGQDGPFFQFPLTETDEFAVASIFESAYQLALNMTKDYIQENSAQLIADGIMTENAVGHSFMVLDTASRRKKAENSMITQLAKKAGDPRYDKMMIHKKLFIRYRNELRNDSRYAGQAKTAVMQRNFNAPIDPRAASARAAQYSARRL